MTARPEDPAKAIADPADLRAHMGAVNPLAERKVLDRLDGFCRDFIALSPFVVLASTGASGAMDASPRGGDDAGRRNGAGRRHESGCGASGRRDSRRRSTVPDDGAAGGRFRARHLRR
jgi:hypothetical protein